MVIHVYLENGAVLGTQVDEVSSPHQPGDVIIHNDKRYIVRNRNDREHLDYQIIVSIVELIQKDPEIEIEGKGLNELELEQLSTHEQSRISKDGLLGIRSVHD